MQTTNRMALSVAAAATLVALSGGIASAQGFSSSNFYVKGFGGLTVPQDDDFQLNAKGGLAARPRPVSTTATATFSGSPAATR